MIRQANPDKGIEAVIDNPETQAILDAIRADTRDLFTLPNECLPECLHDNRSGGRSFENIATILNKAESAERKEMTEKQREKQAKADRVVKYRAQHEAGQECLDYDVDPDRLFSKRLEFVQRAIRSGMMEDDDDRF
jgi:hypothetical protein